MFAPAKEQIACTAVGTTDAGTWSRSFAGRAYRGLGMSVSPVISKQFAHRGSPSNLCLGSIARLGNPEDRP